MRAVIVISLALALAMLITPALAADVTIPLNRDYKYGDMVVHITKAEITDKYRGNTYSADPDNSIWPKVWFYYENKGTTPVDGNLYVAFMDDKGNLYQDSRKNKPIFDSTMGPIDPGTRSDERFLEAAAPKGTKITKIILYNYLGQEDNVIDISSGSTATAPSSTSTPGPSGKGPCAIALALPVLAAGIFMVSRMKR